MKPVIIYSKNNCPYCDWAKQLLDKKNIPYTEIRIDLEPNKAEEMIKLSGRRTVPQIFIDDKPIGGFTELSELDQSGQLDSLLS